VTKSGIPAQPERLDSCYIFLVEVTVKIPDELAAQAKARGLQVEVYVQELLAQQVRNQETHTPRTAAEIRVWLDSLAQFSDKIPPLPSVISRDWIYQEHD
jgi:post-segregation antitoxin (ccd killing protein)